MFKASTGIGYGSDEYTVAVSATSSAMSKLESENINLIPKLVIVFTSVKYNAELVQKGIRSIAGSEAKIIGCSTAGEITEEGTAKQQSIAVMLIASDNVQFTTAVSEDLTKDSELAGGELSGQLKAGTEPDLEKLILMFIDGLRGNGSATLRGINNKLNNAIPVVGGTAGDDDEFKQTYQYHQGSVYTDSVVGVLMSGNLKIGIGVKHGWTAVGLPGLVTEADGSIIRTIDNKEAIDFYTKYLGEDEVKNLRKQTLGQLALSYPLGFKDADTGEMLLRAPFSVGSDGSITCGGEIPEGSYVQIMVGDREDIIKAAKEATLTAVTSYQGEQPEACLIFNCHVRKNFFGSKADTESEMDTVKSVLGKKIPTLGFYTYSEIAPIRKTMNNESELFPQFHNETIVVLLLGEN